MKTITRYHGIGLGVVTLLLFQYLMGRADLVDGWYTGGIYTAVRVVYDSTIGHLPFPFVYLVLPGLLLWLAIPIFVQRRQGVLHMMLHVLHVAGWIVAAFYLLWGYNYCQSGVAKRMELQMPTVRESDRLEQEVVRVTELLCSERRQITEDTVALTSLYLPDDLEGIIRPLLVDLLVEHDLPRPGRPRVRVLQPSGVLLRIGTAGVYLSPTMEGHIDAGLHPIQYPYTLAHEMSHGYSVTDEGECNFLALLACMKSSHPIIRYSALRVYWLYLMRELASLDRSCYASIYAGLPPSVLTDFDSITVQMDRYPDILPAVRDWIYDSYLRSNGVQSGMRSYGQVVGLALAYQDQYGMIR